MLNFFYVQNPNIKHKNKLKEFKDNNIPDDVQFYFNGVYGENSIKSNFMPTNIRRDFNPFLKFLNKSRDSKEKAVSVGAVIHIPDIEQSLILDDSLIMVKNKNFKNFSVSFKEVGIFEVLFSKEALDANDIDAVLIGRNNSVWESTDKDFITICDGRIYIKVKDGKDILDNQDVNIWLKSNPDDCVKATLNLPDCFSLYKSHELSINKECLIRKCEKEDEIIRFFYEGQDPKNIMLFGNSLEVIKSDNHKEEKTGVSFEYKNQKVKIEKIKVNIDDSSDDYDYYRIKNIKLGNDKKKGILKIGDKVTDYTVCTNSEISNVINDNNLIFLSGRFSCKKIESDDEIIEFNGFSFSKDLKHNDFNKNYLRLKNGKKIVGTVIELQEDDNFKNDVYSNVDLMFAESTKYLSDSPIRNKGRKFEIGWKDFNNERMEIAELTRNNHREKIDVKELEGKTLYAVADTSQLSKQITSVYKLINKPISYHKPLLELTEVEDKAIWNDVEDVEIEEDEWFRLTDLSYKGCEEQRKFVKIALGTPDFAFLDGPPGSGKTTTILEIIAQAIKRGKKIMLAASTNAAVDNILERLCDLPSEIRDQILAVRLGSDRISDTVEQYNVNKIDDVEFKNEIISRANLVCSTIFGILQHPEFKETNNKSQPVFPLYDYLIVDEASKTTFQDFLVPALHAKRWILSGDLNQLTPYTEQEDLEAALRENTDFDSNHQYVHSILMLFRNDCGKDIFNKCKLCIPLKDECITAACHLLNKQDYNVNVLVLGDSKVAKNTECPYYISYEDFKNGKNESFIIFGCDILFVEDTVYEDVQKLLTSDFVPVLSSSDNYYLDALNNANKKLQDFSVRMFYKNSYVHNLSELKESFEKEIKNKTWANQIIWRLCRMQELFLYDNSNKQRNSYQNQINSYIAEYKKEEVLKEVNLIRSIALPSILQLLQKGVSNIVVKNKRKTALNSGIPEKHFESRYVILKYQHRMHPEIAEFSRRKFYGSESAKALVTPEEMEAKRNWDCKIWKNRSVWLDVHNNGDCRSKNEKEVDFIVNDLAKFIKWTKDNPNPNSKNKLWSVAILTYYKAQERRLKQKFQMVFSSPRERSYYQDSDSNIEVKIFSVDKFQGQEADVVYISLVKSGNVTIGFMDSPNRLNVALTRAKFQRVIVGNKDYFRRRNDCGILKDLCNNF